MIRVINSERIPIKSWADEIEEGALEQARNLANLPFAFKHIPIMPDVHKGYGMPIGGVLATDGVVIPNAVGLDQGCGMCFRETDVPVESIHRETLVSLRRRILEEIPVGFNHHPNPQEWDGWSPFPNTKVIRREIQSAQYQLGTLGGGNHFIEIQCNRHNQICFMIHSGSRNFGLKIAKEYHQKAKSLCEKWYSNIPHSDLSFLHLDDEDGQDYLSSMRYALQFAKESRKRMMDVVSDIFSDLVNDDVYFSDMIDVHHNYARMENHFGKNVMVHRKGATSAKSGEIGIIPGSQCTSSYIVRGLGNKQSFFSCSHGSGRTMSRTDAKKRLSLEEEKKKLDDQGIIHSVESIKDLEEASGSYKDIDRVIENQLDLVEVVDKLKPLVSIKGQ